MSKQINIRGDFLSILWKAVDEEITGRLEFLEPKGSGIVRISMINGNIYQIDSSWGFGRSEINKILEWKVGECRIKKLTESEIEELKQKNIIMTPAEILLLK
ncbi:MAG: hypothetical protein RMJ38_05360 [candidate division WOR-3 bacterium]|nr:hypothetical protein [candidate division WOR-3 bacterium]MDW8150849.1 hypothetical protein [candidate division WOR-3 bacterium]